MAHPPGDTEERKCSHHDKYLSFCVLKSQAWAPLSMLCRLWKMSETRALDLVDSFCRRNLATSERRTYRVVRLQRDVEEIGLRIHDLQLEYCQQQCQSSETCHKRLLDQYMCLPGRISLPVAAQRTVQPQKKARSFKSFCISCFAPSDETPGTDVADDVKKDYGEEDDRYCVDPRQWWSEQIVEDGYIHENLAWHLARAKAHNELRGLLVDARWTKLRMKIGGLLHVEDDFREATTRAESVRRSGSAGEGAMGDEFMYILNALRCSWPYITGNERELPVQIGARLFSLRSAPPVERYVCSVEKHTARPFLMPCSSFLPDARILQMMEVPLGDACAGVAYSACGRRLAVGAGADVVLIDVESGRGVVARLRGHTALVSGVVFAPGGSELVSASSDGTLRVWRLDKDGMPLREDTAVVLRGHTDIVSGVCATVDVNNSGVLVASASNDESVRRWDGSNGAPLGDAWRGHERGVTDVAASDDGVLLASASRDGYVVLWAARDGTELARARVGGGDHEAVRAVTVRADGSAVAAGTESGLVCVWDVTMEDGQAILSARRELRGHGDAVGCVTFNARGDMLASGGGDLTVRLWDVSSARAIGEPLEGHSAFVAGVAFGGSGEVVASGSYDGTVRLWDVAQATRVRVVAADEQQQRRHDVRPAHGAAFSTDGQLLATGHTDGTIRLCHARSGDVQRRLRGHDGTVTTLAFGSGGTLLASGGYDCTVRLWNTRSGEGGEALRGHEDTVWCVTVSNDEYHVASASGDNTVRVWTRREADGAFVERAVLRGHTDSVFAVAFSNDGARLASGSRDHSVRVWHAWRDNHGEVHTLSGGHARNVVRVAFDKDGQHVLSECVGGIRCVWNATSGQPLHELLNVSDGSDEEALAIVHDVRAVDNGVRDVYCVQHAVVMEHDGAEVQLASLPGLCIDGVVWKFFEDEELFAVVLMSGKVARLRLCY